MVTGLEYAKNTSEVQQNIFLGHIHQWGGHKKSTQALFPSSNMDSGMSVRVE